MRAIVIGEDPTPLLPLIDVAIAAVERTDDLRLTGSGPRVRFKGDLAAPATPCHLDLFRNGAERLAIRVSRIANAFRASFRPDIRAASDPDLVVAWDLGDERCETPPDKAYVLSRLAGIRDILAASHSACAERDLERSLATVRTSLLQEIGDGSFAIDPPGATHGSIIGTGPGRMWFEQFGHMGEAFAKAVRDPVRDVVAVSSTSKQRRDGEIRRHVDIGRLPRMRFDAPEPFEAIALARMAADPGPGPHLLPR